MARFPLAAVTHETAATSDHSALLVELGRRKKEHKMREFRYELMWETHEGLHDMLVDGWDAGPPCATVEEMRQKLSNLARGLTRWSNDTFGSVRKEIKLLKRRLDELRGDPLRTGPSHVELKIRPGPHDNTMVQPIRLPPRLRKYGRAHWHKSKAQNLKRVSDPTKCAKPVNPQKQPSLPCGCGLSPNPKTLPPSLPAVSPPSSSRVLPPFPRSPQNPS